MSQGDFGGSRRRVKSYVLRGGRLSKAQGRALALYRDTFCIPFQESLLDMNELYRNAIQDGGEPDIVVEIGFGMGDATAAIASEHPAKLYLGIEVFTAGVGKLLDEISKRNLANVRIIQHDAVEVLRYMIPDGTIAGLHVFFPDPWPKKKHHKRRLIQDAFAEMASHKLKNDGYIYVVTDWEEYAEQILAVLARTEGLHNPYAESASPGYAPPQPWRPNTKFERKGLDKRHTIRELLAYKKKTIAVR